MDVEHHHRQDLFTFIRYSFKVGAMYPMKLTTRLSDRTIQLLNLLHELIMYFVVLHLVILYICTFYISMGDGDLEFLASTLLQTIIYVWTFIIKFYFRRISPQHFQDLMDTINLKYHIKSAPGLSYVTMQDAIKKSNLWIKRYQSCCYSGGIMWAMLPIFLRERKLPLECWYPFDFKQPIVFELLYMLQVIAQIQVATAFSSSSAFHMILSILISGQYDILYCSLKNIVATAYISAGADSRALRNLKIEQDISELEVNQYYCSTEHQSSIPDLIKKRENQNLVPKKLSNAFKDAFEQCVCHHRYIVKILYKMERFYNPIWFFKISVTIFLVCLAAFVSVKSTEEKSLMRMMSLGQYMFLLLLEKLVICYFSEVIFLNSQRCGEALLRSPWHLHLLEMRHDFLFFLHNSKRHFQLSGGKIYNLNVDRFRNTITTAFSFFTFLQKMDVHN